MRRKGGSKGGDPAPIAVLIVFVFSVALLAAVPSKAEEEELAPLLINGFTATHAAADAASAPFEPVLYAPNRAFAFGFLRVGAASLDLAVVHLPSSFPVWRATPARTGDWSRPATLTFDTSLVLTDPDRGELWRTPNAVGDTVALLNSSNLVVRRYGDVEEEEGRALAWQSFENPSDTLVVGQNFTAASTPLVSGNRRFALRLGKTYMALQMEFYGGRATATPPTTTYWRHTALEAQPENATEPPVYGRIDARGFFGLYVTEGQRVDVLSFDTFAQNFTGVVFRRMTLEDDGNLRSYYWTDETKAWKQEFKAISVRCELPTACGAYGLCVPGGEAQCQCLTNSTGTGTSTASSSSSSSSPPCHGAADDEEDETADLCGVNGENGFDVVRRTRVSVAYKEWLPFETFPTSAECERACAANCSCWGAAYNGASGYCYYLVGFPVQTVVYDSDERKVGYFKVLRTPSSARRRRRGMSTGVRAATAVLALVLAGLAMAGAYTGYRTWERKRRRNEGMEQELAPGPYRDLKSLGSSNSSNSSFKA